MLYDGNFNHNEFVSAILWESVVFKGIGYLCIEDAVEERSNLKFLFMNKILWGKNLRNKRELLLQWHNLSYSSIATSFFHNCLGHRHVIVCPLGMIQAWEWFTFKLLLIFSNILFHLSRCLSHETKILLLEILREYHNCQLSGDGVRFRCFTNFLLYYFDALLL